MNELGFIGARLRAMLTCANLIDILAPAGLRP
jgi:hypothetical protein